jgi:uncharacterized protein (UPF0276 family)
MGTGHTAAASRETVRAASGIRFPAVSGRLGLGVGFDLPWGGAVGFVPDPASGHDVLAPPLRRFLARPLPRWSHAFFSWQPRARSRLRLADYVPAWDDLVTHVPAGTVRALHHTALDLGALAPGDRGALCDFTSALCERYELRWINEDLGLWSLGGKPLPYPLPPFLTDAGLAAAVRSIDDCQRRLAVPLVVEFPGFSRGVSVVVGPWDAYDYFRVLAETTGSAVTLDVGHLLSWRWLRGARGAALLEGIERLPLSHCFEIHLSGCEIVGDCFIDAHHGVLLDAQLELLARLVDACPNLAAITFEDPRLDEVGALEPGSRASLARLEEATRAWNPR